MKFDFRHIRRFFSTEARSENPTDQQPPTPEQAAAPDEAPANLEALLEQLKQEAADDLQQLERDGTDDGRLLFVDPAHKIGQIEKKYAGIAEALDHTYNARRRREYERAVKEAEVLKADLDRLRPDLDQNNPDSLLSRLKARQETLSGQLLEEQGRGFNDEFASRYYQAGKDHFAAEQEHLQNLKEELNETKSWLREEIAAIRNILRGAYQSIGGQKHGAAAQQVQETRSVLDELPLGFDVLNRVEDAGDEILNKKSSRIGAQLSAIDAYSKNHKPLMMPKGLIITHYVMSVIILLGEYFLVYKLLAKTLGHVEAVSSALPADLAILSRLVVVFCFAYPLAIGMAFKFRYQDEPDKPGLLRRWARWGLPAIILSLFLIAFPNAMQIAEIDFNDGTENWIRVGCIMVFLTVLTTVFSAIGSLLFAQASDQHREYLNLTHRPVFGRSQSPQYYALEKQIKNVEAEIAELHRSCEELQERWLRVEAVARVPFKAVDFKKITGHYMQSACSSYRTGFDRGRSQVLHEKDEAELARLHMRLKIHTTNNSKP